MEKQKTKMSFKPLGLEITVFDKEDQEKPVRFIDAKYALTAETIIKNQRFFQ